MKAPVPALRTPADNVVRVWVSLMRGQQSTLKAIEADLKATNLPSLAWYDVLLELRRSESGLRPLELESRLLLEQHNISRLLDRLVAAGLAEKHPCPQDGRGQIAAITPGGKEMLQRMWPVYADAIQRHIGDRLGAEADVKALASVLDMLCVTGPC